MLVHLEHADPILAPKDLFQLVVRQDFPASLEFQLLGAGNGVKSTGNLCTPSTYITLDGKVNKTHCIYSQEPTKPLGEWVKAEAEVRWIDTIVDDLQRGSLTWKPGPV